MAEESPPGIFLFVSEWVVTALLPVLFLKYYYYYYFVSSFIWGIYNNIPETNHVYGVNVMLFHT